ncbi:PIN domain-containing protein [Methanoregula sp.]|uniref:PIN domain-containing protein n=1 Tax=Methanoregula sp. TaxID=2052170 RepID=UPI0025F451E7|nr:PIN domain-containing protein [Methanoregula sp.]
MTARPALIDTNILCYALDTSDPVKRAVAADLLSQCWRSEIDLSVSVQNLAEFSVVMTEKVKNPVPDETVIRFIRNIASFDGWTIISYDAETILDALNIQKNYSLHFWDALLAATMRQHSIESIFTEDSHFNKVSWIKTINPFQPDKSSRNE